MAISLLRLKYIESMNIISSDKIAIDIALVRQLVDTQFPQWAALPIRPVESPGWDNRTFHLGETMSVRLPSAEGYVPQAAKEQHTMNAIVNEYEQQL